MKTLKNLKITKKTLVTNKMRTVLALLGIIVGVSAVIVMVAIGNGARQEVVSRIESMGTNLIIVNAGDLRTFAGRRQIRGKATTLTLDDADSIRNQFPEVVSAVPSQSEKMQAKYGNFSTSTDVVGTTPGFKEVRNFGMKSGWFFSSRENRVSRRVAVLGSGVAENLFEGENPLGAIIRIGKVPFEVIGVLESKGVDIYGSDQDDQIIIPVNTAIRRVFNLDYIDAIYLEIDRKENMQPVLAEVRNLLRRRHHLEKANKPDDFTIQSQTELIQAEKETSDTFTSLTAGIAGISLLVGGVGILAVMLLSVRERRNEIGLRMAVGASRKDVLVQFLSESSVLGLGGGIAGIIIGIAASLFMKWILLWSMVISPFAIAVSFGFSLLIGIFFGMYPAHRASLLDPIEALRSE